MTTKVKFQQHCEKLVALVTDLDKIHYNKFDHELEKVRFLYPLALSVDIDVATWAPKGMERAMSLKVSGNLLFQDRNHYHAINAYNEGIIRCPQDNLECKKLYAILIANRSAVFFELKQFEKVLKDVHFLEILKHHPAPWKWLLRGAKAAEELKNFPLALNHYKAVLNHSTDSGINSQIIENKMKELTKIKYTINNERNEELVWKSNNITYPALSSKLLVKNDHESGRCVFATQDIEPGEIVAIENPYVCVLNGTMYKTNCAFCCLSINCLISCENCCQACYCSFECKERAFSYHQHECKILLTLYDNGVSVNCLMALRIITHRQLAQVLQDEKYTNEERNVVIYKTNDYYNVNQLVAHKDKARRHSDESLHYGFMAVYLLRLLKLTEYFNDNKNNMEVDIFVGGLLLKYLEILQYNAHEVAELQNITSAKGDHSENYQSGTVAAGLYPTLALFNHSCDPSVIRYNIGNMMVLRAVKIIKYGEGVYENYGPLYTTDVLQMRQEKMLNLYRFECKCEACMQDWPLFGDINPNILRIACECGNVIPTSKDIEMPFITCNKCKKDKNLFGVLTGLMPLEVKSQTAENILIQGKYNEAQDILVEMLLTYGKYLKAPFSDMVLLQQRLKTCLIHRGNKKFDYHH